MKRPGVQRAIVLFLGHVCMFGAVCRLLLNCLAFHVHVVCFGDPVLSGGVTEQTRK